MIKFPVNYKVLIPTHFRFNREEDAKHWGTDTKSWHQIAEINISEREISSTEFAWVSFDFEELDLEFKHDPAHLKEDNGDEDDYEE